MPSFVVLSYESYPAHWIHPHILSVMLLGLILFLYRPSLIIWFSWGAILCLPYHSASYPFDIELHQSPPLFNPGPSELWGPHHPLWSCILMEFCVPDISCTHPLFVWLASWYGISLAKYHLTWSHVLSQPISPVPVAPGCCSSSLPECLSWTHPLSSVASSSDLSLSSWEPFCLLPASILALPPPSYLRASIDSRL